MGTILPKRAPKLKWMTLTLDLRKLDRLRRVLGARDRSEAVQMAVNRELAILKEMRASRYPRKRWMHSI